MKRIGWIICTAFAVAGAGVVAAAVLRAKSSGELLYSNTPDGTALDDMSPLETLTVFGVAKLWVPQDGSLAGSVVLVGFEDRLDHFSPALGGAFSERSGGFVLERLLNHPAYGDYRAQGAQLVVSTGDAANAPNPHAVMGLGKAAQVLATAVRRVHNQRY